MSSQKWHPDSEQHRENLLALREASQRRRLIRQDAGEELVDWLLYTIGFAMVPFLMNVVVLFFLSIDRLNVKNIIQVQTVVFLGIMVCGTLLERLSSFDSRSSFHRKMCKLGTWAYTVAALMLAGGYALCTWQSAGGGGSYNPYVIGVAAAFVGVLVFVSAGIYWLLHYGWYSPRKIEV